MTELQGMLEELYTPKEGARQIMAYTLSCTGVSQPQAGSTPYLESCPRIAPLGWAVLWTLT